jgi:hypothetical protein
LSSAWLSSLEGALRALTPDDLPPEHVALGVLVTGGPDGEIRYTIHVGGGVPARVAENTLEGAAVTIVEDYETASAIASGEAPNAFLAAGRIKLRGRTAVLLAAQEHLARALAALATMCVDT